VPDDGGLLQCNEAAAAQPTQSRREAAATKRPRSCRFVDPAMQGASGTLPNAARRANPNDWLAMGKSARCRRAGSTSKTLTRHWRPPYPVEIGETHFLKKQSATSTGPASGPFHIGVQGGLP
jgi:hypothetical protein